MIHIALNMIISKGVLDKHLLLWLANMPRYVAFIATAILLVATTDRDFFVPAFGALSTEFLEVVRRYINRFHLYLNDSNFKNEIA